MNIRKISYCLLLSAAFISLTIITAGCWDKDEPEEVALVIMVAFDADEEDGLIKIAAQVANPLGAAEAEEDGGAGKDPTWTVEAKGHSTYEAIQNLELKSTRVLDWGHLEVLVISEAMAEKGLRPILDYFDREHQARLITRPMVVRGEVTKLMEMEFPMEPVGGLGVSKYLLQTQEGRSVSTGIDSMRLMFQKLSNPGKDLALPLGKMVVEEEGEGEEEEQMKGTIEFTGGAVFRKDKLAGSMDEREARGMMWITGEVARATLVVPCPGCEEASITLEVFQSETELEPKITESKPRFELQVRAESRIQDFACPEAPV